MEDNPPTASFGAGSGESAVAVAAAADARAVPRTNLFIAATLQWADASTPVKIRDLSEVGAQIESSLHLDIGTAVTLVRGKLRIAGQVSWSKERRCGLKFAAHISVADWMANPAHQGQQHVDHLVALVKGVTAPLAGPSDDAEAPGELADDLRRIGRLLDKLGDALANDAATVARHGNELQSLDIAAQTLAALADAAQPDASLGATGRAARLGELRTSCLEALRSSS